jgi:hypothetical protein
MAPGKICGKSIGTRRLSSARLDHFFNRSSIVGCPATLASDHALSREPCTKMGTSVRDWFCAIGGSHLRIGGCERPSSRASLFIILGLGTLRDISDHWRGRCACELCGGSQCGNIEARVAANCQVAGTFSRIRAGSAAGPCYGAHCRCSCRSSSCRRGLYSRWGGGMRTRFRRRDCRVPTKERSLEHRPCLVHCASLVCEQLQRWRCRLSRVDCA